MPGQGFDQVLAHHGRVPTRAAGRHHDALDRAQLLRREVQAAELGRGVVAIEPAAHGVLDRFGLLEDLLEHVVLVAADGRRRRASNSSTSNAVDHVALVAVDHPHRVGA